MTDNSFSTRLLHWFAQNGRKNLPWQHPRHPYRVWISEIMLQQTQVQTVIPYFERFMQRFATIELLAQADEDAVLSLWSGLGYYSRARNLHKTAQIICQHYQGEFPKDLQILASLPGIGKSTAAAILAQAFDMPTAILDANVKRVLARYFMVKGVPEHSKVKTRLWELAQHCMPSKHCADYTQAIMDLGATCCRNKNPQCQICPLQDQCLAYKNQVPHLYPHKKDKKPVPLQEQQFLVLTNDKQQIYLEKRPPTGVWGGLWCLPSLDVDLCPLTYIQSHYALAGKAAEELMVFTHKFSHFHLQIKARRIHTHIIANKIAEPRGLWFKQEQLQSLGLAKPTSKILASLWD